MIYLIALIAGIAVGSVPFGLVLARIMRGIDIREHGSGNIGATNVARVVGKGAGLLTFVLDVSKGLAPALVFKHLFSTNVGIVAGLGAIGGHIFSPVLRFKGGKGVATSLGVFIGLAPITSGVGFVAWLIFFLAFRWVSLASVVGAIAVPVFLYLSRGLGIREFNPGIMVLALAATLAVVVRHAGNMKRLVRGQEPRFSLKTSERKDES